jgi:Transposase, Mutator family
VRVVDASRGVRVELDGIVGLGDLEEAAVAFARSAPAVLVGAAIESMIDQVVGAVVGPFGSPLAVAAQLRAPWACSGCGSVHGFRRRGFRPKPRRLMTRCGQVAFRSQQLECMSCERRFAPAAQLLGVGSHQRRSDALTQQAASLAVEVAYAKASRLLAELAGTVVSPRSIRRGVIAMAPAQIGPDAAGEVPVLLLDGTGERAGPDKFGVALHLAIGLIARRRQGKRVAVEARLLGATLGESWPVMFDLLGEVRPGLIVLDGEPELSILAAERFAGVPVQRCLWHLRRGFYKIARYKDRCAADTVGELAAELDDLLVAAYRRGNHATAVADYQTLIERTEAAGAHRAARFLRDAITEAFTFLTNPTAGRLVFGDKGRPDLGTGVLERVIREMNRRTDVGVRWSIPGIRAILMAKLQRNYGHGPWAPHPEPDRQPTVRFTLVA